MPFPETRVSHAPAKTKIKALKWLCWN